MSLKYAILGLLSVKPQSGYELKANFDRAIRYLWKADQAQIYRTLRTITKQGLAVSRTIQQIGRPNKKVYEMTSAGEDDLRRWLSDPLPPNEQRNAELVQIFFSGQISDADILTSLKRIRENLKAGLAGLTSLETNSELFAKNTTSSRVHFFFEMTRQLGIQSAKLNLKWVEEVIAKIKYGDLSQE
ncbi:MAG: PadR family transcriptional regulator [Desulfobacteraceae bacterium]|jgi:DNA-binding PadR family transcriptional regulator